MKRRPECALCGVLVRRRTGAMAHLRNRRNRVVRKRVCSQCARERCILVAVDVGTWLVGNTVLRRPTKQQTLDKWFTETPLEEQAARAVADLSPAHSGEKGRGGFDGA
jgi:hypothetical protein